MILLLRRAGVGLASSLLAALPATGANQGERPASRASEKPIAASIDRVVERYVRDRLLPCLRAEAEGVPCFPVSVETEGPRYSVADSLRQMRFDDAPSPDRPPTMTEMGPYRPGPLSAYGTFFTVDPVCKTKWLVDKIAGKGRAYYLYRVWDATGERADLRDHPLVPERFAEVSGFRYEPLGQFDDECEALAAYRRLQREIVSKSQSQR